MGFLEDERVRESGERDWEEDRDGEGDGGENVLVDEVETGMRGVKVVGEDEGCV